MTSHNIVSIIHIVRNNITKMRPLLYNFNWLTTNKKYWCTSVYFSVVTFGTKVHTFSGLTFRTLDLPYNREILGLTSSRVAIKWSLLG